MLGIRAFSHFALYAAVAAFGGIVTIVAMAGGSAPSIEGSRGTGLACDGTWNVVPGATVPGQASLLADVAAVSAADVWAVGSATTDAFGTSQTVIEHWDGSGWTIVPGANGGAGALSSVAIVSAADIWAVGSTPGNSVSNTVLIEHWDGSEWAVVEGPTPGEYSVLSGVSALSATDVWAVGSSVDSSHKQRTLIEHWDGSAWTVVMSPSPGGMSELSDVVALSADDVWAVGSTAAVWPGPPDALIMHWDGLAWSVQPAPDPGDPSTYNVLRGIAAISASDVWAAGNILVHWDGEQWIHHPGAAGASDLSALSNDAVWAVGTMAQRWNGTSWHEMAGIAPSSELQGVAALQAGPVEEVWAVGLAFQGGGLHNTLIEHYCGTPPTATPSPSPSPFPPTESTLSQEAAAGSSVLQLADSAGFFPRDLIVINYGGTTEERSVVAGLGSLHLSAPLLFNHAFGERVVKFGQAVRPGDTDCNGSTDSVDALQVLRRVAGVVPYSLCWAAGNVSCLDDINSVDALRILRFVVALPPNLPAGCPAIGVLSTPIPSPTATPTATPSHTPESITPAPTVTPTPM